MGTTQQDISGPSKADCQRCGDTHPTEDLDNETGLCERCAKEEEEKS